MRTYTEEDEEIHILDDLIRFADHHRSFDRRFVDDVYEFLDEKGYITEAQMEALGKMYQQNHVRDFLNSDV